LACSERRSSVSADNSESSCVWHPSIFGQMKIVHPKMKECSIGLLETNGTLRGLCDSEYQQVS
jgi:hypothetical protein